MVSDVSLQSAITQQADSSAAQTSLATDFTQFLTLLTTQLQNQDPLEPTDSTEFTNQLVAFTAVEQQINTNQRLDSLVALSLSNSVASSQNYVGQDISYVSSEFNFDGSPNSIRYSLPEASSQTTLRILNESGAEIYSEEVSGSLGASDFSWDGRLTGGGIAEEGTYEVVIDALNDNGDAIQATTVVTGTVEGVEAQNGQIFLLVGDRAVSVGNVLNTTIGSNIENATTALTSSLSYIGLDISYENDRLNLTNGEDQDINYTLPVGVDRASILIYDDTDQLVFSDRIDNLSPGSKTYTLDGSGFTAGEYRYEIDAIAQDSALIRQTTPTYDGSVPVEIEYTLQNAADRVEIVVTDEQGDVVFEGIGNAASGTQSFVWTPDDDIEAGDYRFEVTAFAEEDTNVPVASTTVGRVTGVESDNGVIFVELSTGRTIPLSEILSVTVPEEEDV